MLAKRIIPCLDVHEGRVVKGIKFINLKDAGDPVEIAALYDREGADELAFLDISASFEARDIIIELVERVASQVFIPFTVGGGVRTVEDIRMILRAGADKVSVNTAAIKNPGLISEASGRFGSQCGVVAIDAKKRDDGTGWDVYINGGRVNTGKDAVKWAIEAEKLGAGEILLTSIDRDGTKTGLRPGPDAYCGGEYGNTGNSFRRRRKHGAFFGGAYGRKSGRGPCGVALPLQGYGNNRPEKVPEGKRGGGAPGYVIQRHLVRSGSSQLGPAAFTSALLFMIRPGSSRLGPKACTSTG